MAPSPISMSDSIQRSVSRPVRLLLGALLLALALPTSLAWAQAPLHAGHRAADHDATLGAFVLHVDDEGNVVCEEADEADLQALGRPSGEPLNFTVVPSTNDPSEIEGMRILLRATDQLLEFPEALLAFRRAAARWERAISSPITVVIDVDYGPERFDSGPYPANVLGSANSAPYFAGGVQNNIGPQGIVDALKAQHPGDPQLQALYDAIPIPTPSTAQGAFLNLAIGARANLQALGLFPAETSTDPSINPFGDVANIGFNSAFNYDFDPSDGIGSGLTDFEGVAVHEIGHTLGFNSIIGSGGPPNNLFYVWDLFRVRPDSVSAGESYFDGEGWETTPRVVTPGPPNTEVLVVINGTTYYKPVQTFFDGLDELDTSTATGSRQGGDGQQASHWRDDALRPPTLGEDRKIGIMDPNLGSGTRDEYTPNDLRMLEVIGYNVDYAPVFADADVTVNGEPYDFAPPDSLEFIDLGDPAPGGTVELALGLTNTSETAALNYSVEVDLEVGFPSDVDPTLSVDAPEGSIAPGAAQTVTLTAGADERSLFYGVLRVETNIDGALVIEVPFQFSIDGGTAPQLALSTDDAGNLGDFDGEGPETRPLVTVSNEGGLGLDYRAAVTFVQNAEPFPFNPLPRGAGGELLFEEDFEDGLGGFIAGGAFPGDWQVVDIGPATLEGHSQPNAAYFGQVLQDGTLLYRNGASGILVSPPLDVSAVPQQDLVVLSFNHYLQAETGSDFATVFVSFDDGDTFQEVATSNGGVLRNTTGWENVSIELPLVAGLPTPIRVAFQFVADPSDTRLGWLVDDVTLNTLPDAIPAFVTPVAGTIPGGAEQQLSLTVEGAQLETGFYRGAVTLLTNSLEFSDAGVPVGYTDGDLRVTGVRRSVPFTLSVGDPGVPDLTPQDTPVTVSVPSNRTLDVELDVENMGGASVTFVRLLEPALGEFLAAERAGGSALPNPLLANADGGAEASLLDEPLDTQAARSVVAGGDSLFSAELTGVSPSIGAITQLPDGGVVVADFGSNGRTYVFTEDLSRLLVEIDGVLGGRSVTGIAYNDATRSLWYATDDGLVFEVAFDGSELTRTGRLFDLSFMEDGPGSISYSAELGAFFVPERRSQALYAVDESGTLLPGYPVNVPSRGGLSPGVSVTRGVVEVLADNRVYTQTSQFGRDFEEAVEVEVPRDRLGDASRINGLLRSRTNPDGVLYYLTRPSGGVARIVGVDPPDLPASTRTLIEAEEALFGRELEPGEAQTLVARVAPEGRDVGMYADTLTFLTNNPTDRIVRIPFEIGVTEANSTEDESTIPSVFALRPNYPNPFADRTTLTFDLPTSASASLTVYNVLGQRVAVLLDAETLEAGVHEVAFDAGNLTTGTYIVQLRARDYVGSQRITVVR